MMQRGEQCLCSQWFGCVSEEESKVSHISAEQTADESGNSCHDTAPKGWVVSIELSKHRSQAIAVV
jgi:hypothetical protein